MVDGRIASDVILGETMRICEYLRGSELFQHMSPHEISNVAEKMLKKTLAAGETVVTQGDEGDAFYLIGTGGVDVLVNGEKVAELADGDFFGEASLISGEPRNATVLATSELILYSLGAEHFRAALDSNETFKEQLLKVFFQRQ